MPEAGICPPPGNKQTPTGTVETCTEGVCLLTRYHLLFTAAGERTRQPQPDNGRCPLSVTGKPGQRLPSGKTAFSARLRDVFGRGADAFLSADKKLSVFRLFAHYLFPVMAFDMNLSWLTFTDDYRRVSPVCQVHIRLIIIKRLLRTFIFFWNEMFGKNYAPPMEKRHAKDSIWPERKLKNANLRKIIENESKICKNAQKLIQVTRRRRIFRPKRILYGEKHPRCEISE